GNLMPYQYTGRYTEAATGLVHLDARWYNPHTQRFMQPDLWNFRNTGLPSEIQHELMRFTGLDTAQLLRDPSQQMAYGYVSGNPLAWVDWLGLCETRVFIGGHIGYVGHEPTSWERADAFNIVTESAKNAEGSASFSITGNVRVGYLASFRINKVFGATIDLGSAKREDRVGEYWTRRGKVIEYSEGRTLASVDFLGASASAENTTSDNGKTWDYGNIELTGPTLDLLNSESNSMEFDYSIGIGFVYEGTVTVPKLW
ncbi:RHS repeat-associated core domain-containing protein, partial [Saccharospirillum alexandrii]|uniref:RHS repeat-associated core domain-containing protein n=1 Tax=Saccharospirillum alexandrii TaxID=2448477 RepID=UPI0013DF1BED